MKFNEKLQKLRKENDLSQEALADKLDVSRQAVSKWESGQTYPEMDKLLTMCKIFNCSLDELTNDEVMEIGKSTSQKVNVKSMIDDLLDLLRKSYNMIRSMSFREFIKFFIEMFIIFILLLLFHIPFESLYELGRNIFMNFGTSIGNVLSSIFDFIITITYFIISVLIFFYIFKIRFIENYEEEKKEKYLEEEHSGEKEIKKVYSIPKKEKNSSFFQTLGFLAYGFIKCMLLLWGIPFIFSFVFLCMALIISIILALYGAVFFGAIIGILAAIVLNALVIEWVFRVVCNQKIAFKRMLITLITSLAVLGIGIGITLYDFSRIEYIDDVPNATIKKEIVKEYHKDQVHFFSGYYDNQFVDYVVDDSREDTIKVVLTYYSDYANYDLELSGNQNIITNRGNKTVSFWPVIKESIQDLAQKKMYNYSLLTEPRVTIYAKAETIEKLKQNYEEYIKNRMEEASRQEMESYQNQMDSYVEELNKLREEMSKKESQNEELKNKVQMYKDRIEQYKSNFDDL